jgi:hypothetical protein
LRIRSADAARARVLWRVGEGDCFPRFPLLSPALNCLNSVPNHLPLQVTNAVGGSAGNLGEFFADGAGDIVD